VFVTGQTIMSLVGGTTSYLLVYPIDENTIVLTHILTTGANSFVINVVKVLDYYFKKAERGGKFRPLVLLIFYILLCYHYLNERKILVLGTN